MILMLAPGPNMTFGSMPSGATYASDQYSLIKITSNSTADQTALTNAGCYTLTPFGGWGSGMIDTLADLYAADAVNGLILPGQVGYPRYTAIGIYNDSANNGTWAKSGSGVGSGNWTQISTSTAVSAANIATTAAAGAAASLTQAQLLLANAATVSPAVPVAREAQATTDVNGKMIEDVDVASGRRNIANAKIRTLNGRRPEALTLGQQAYATRFADCALFIGNTGQSRAQSNIQRGQLTTVQDGKAVAYPYGVQNPTGYYPLLATNGTVTGYDPSGTYISGDFPTIGLFEFLYELLWKENGLLPTDLGMVPFTANNALGGTAISANNKGTARYNQSIGQLQRLVATDAPALGLKARALGNFWSQGEADLANGYAYYLAALGTLAQNFATDWLAQLPHQPSSLIPQLVACAVDSYGSGPDRFGVSRAILQLAINFAAGVANAPPVGFSTPTYHMDFRGDQTGQTPLSGNSVAGVHLMARDAKWLGAYAALYFKRVFFDQVSWAPLVPKLVEIENGAIFVTFQMRAPNTKLVVAETLDVNQTFNGRLVYQQLGRGWSGIDASGNPLAFTQLPDVVGPSTIRLIPTVSPSTVTRIDYGQQPAVKMWPFGAFTPSGSGTGSGAGNFRDSYGDLVTYDGANGLASAVNRRMDNWIPLHSILPATGSTGFTWPTS